MNKILQETLKSSPSAIMDLYIADLSAIYPDVAPVYFFNGTTTEYTNVVWQGIEYTAYPITIEGFEWSGQGRMPNPKATLANINGFVTALNMEYNDLVGMKVTRKRTFLKFMDAVNFESGLNEQADPSAEFPEEIYFVDRKSLENSKIVEYELVSALDVSGVKIPKRLIIQNLCLWKYKGPECGYTGTNYFDSYGNVLLTPEGDVCGHRLSDCRNRFGVTSVLNFGGFPGASLTL